MSTPRDHQQHDDQGRHPGAHLGAGSPPVVYIDGDLVILDLRPVGLTLTADGMVACYGYAQGYLARVTQDTLDDITPSSAGLNLPVPHRDRRRVAAAFASILSRPGMVRPATVLEQFSVPGNGENHDMQGGEELT